MVDDLLEANGGYERARRGTKREDKPRGAGMHDIPRPTTNAPFNLGAKRSKDPFRRPAPAKKRG